MSNALLSQVRFCRTELKDCKLIRAELFRASLRGVDLRDCDISGIVVSRELAELKGLIVSYDQAAQLAGLMGLVIK